MCPNLSSPAAAFPQWLVALLRSRQAQMAFMQFWSISKEPGATRTTDHEAPIEAKPRSLGGAIAIFAKYSARPLLVFRRTIRLELLVRVVGPAFATQFRNFAKLLQEQLTGLGRDVLFRIQFDVCTVGDFCEDLKDDFLGVGDPLLVPEELHVQFSDLWQIRHAKLEVGLAAGTFERLAEHVNLLLFGNVAGLDDVKLRRTVLGDFQPGDWRLEPRGALPDVIEDLAISYFASGLMNANIAADSQADFATPFRGGA